MAGSSGLANGVETITALAPEFSSMEWSRSVLVV
jgi:hypothetical protein